MSHEPIGYVFEYELGALAVFLIIILRNFITRRFPNQKNRLFSLILWTSFADVVLDVVSGYTIDNVFRVPLYATYIANTLFYLSTSLMLMLMMIYSYALAGYISKERFKRIIPLLVPGVIVVLLLISNPFTNWIFYVDPVLGYIRGTLFIFLYVICFTYIVFTHMIIEKNRRSMRREEFLTISLFLIVILVFTVIQFFYPRYLITGVAIVFSVTLMYFTIQNPESMVDTTTGAFTYEAMLTFLRDRMQERDNVQIVAVKINNMSRINDLLGVENGSLLLRQVCTFLGEGANDTWIFRMRGSSFVAVTRREQDYNAIRKRINRRIGDAWTVNGTEIFLQAVVCCIKPEGLLIGPISPEETVNYLETAFSENEHSGGRIVNITVGQELLDRIKRRNSIETELRSALDSGDGLELNYQPIWSVSRKRYVSAEVLLRYEHPLLGRIPPDEFIAIAENNGFITALDEFVVRKACEFMHEHGDLRELGLENIDVNLSALEFMRRRLPELLQSIMAQYHADPRFICFEVTETAATESYELLRDSMSEIMRFGCIFALDDFGTGYANISQVIQLPFSIVKLDKSVLYGPPAVLEDLIRMFTRIGRETVVEGIETTQQAELVTSFEADFIQGFYCARPMNGEALCQFLKDNAPGDI